MSVAGLMLEFMMKNPLQPLSFKKGHIMLIFRSILLFGGLSRIGLNTSFSKTFYFSHMVHCCSIPYHAVSLTLDFSYGVRYLAPIQSLVRVAHVHHLMGRMLSKVVSSQIMVATVCLLII